MVYSDPPPCVPLLVVENLNGCPLLELSDWSKVNVPPSDNSSVTAFAAKSSNLYLLPPSDTTFTTYFFFGGLAPIQFHDAKVSLFPFISESLPILKTY